MILDIEQIRRKIIAIVESLGLEIVEEKIGTNRGVLNVKLLVDYPEGGIDIDTCGRANRQVVEYLESLSDVVPDYAVEISSPGLDRKLKGRKDFQKVRGQYVEVLLTQKINRKGQWSGRLAEVSEDGISLEIKKGKGTVWLFIPYDKIQQGRIVL